MTLVIEIGSNQDYKLKRVLKEIEDLFGTLTKDESLVIECSIKPSKVFL